MRETLATAIAALLIAFVVAGPAGLLVSLPPVVVTILQTVLPFGFSCIAWVVWRRASGTTARIGSLGMLLLATVWIVGSILPIPLESFLVVQILTVTAVTALVIGPGWRWLGLRIRSLWESAEVR